MCKLAKRRPIVSAFRQETQLVQRLIVERAHRWVFARKPAPGVVQVRPWCPMMRFSLRNRMPGSTGTKSKVTLAKKPHIPLPNLDPRKCILSWVKPDLTIGEGTHVHRQHSRTSHPGISRPTAARFYALAEVPPEREWFANVPNESTRRAYKLDLTDFMASLGLTAPKISASSLGRTSSPGAKISSVGSCRRRPFGGSSRRCPRLFEYLCERNAVPLNPVKVVKRPKANNNEGTTPALSDEQARKLLKAPPEDTLKGVRDRAILAILLFRGIRRAELWTLRCVTTSDGKALCTCASKAKATRCA